MPSFPRKRLMLGLALAGFSDLTQAAGFALIEQNASGLGNAYAGAGRQSLKMPVRYFFNPAGMTLLPDTQVVVAGHLIQPSAKFSGTFSAPVGGGQGGDAGGVAFVPNLYFVHPLTRDVHLGVGINAPFGLKTDYDAGWVGSLSGAQIRNQDDQCQPFDRLENQRSAFAGRGPGHPAYRGDPVQQYFTLGARVR